MSEVQNVEMQNLLDPVIEDTFFMETLEGENLVQFQGLDECDTKLILRRATLGADCEDKGRVIVEVISKNFKDKKVNGPLCSLTLKSNCSVSLDCLCLTPPVAFKLTKGQGPVTLIGNVMKQIDPSLESDSEPEAQAEEEENAAQESDSAAESPTAESGVESSHSNSDDMVDEAPQKRQAEPEIENQPTKQEIAVVANIKAEIEDAKSEEASPKKAKKKKKSKKNKKVEQEEDEEEAEAEPEPEAEAEAEPEVEEPKEEEPPKKKRKKSKKEKKQKADEPEAPTEEPEEEPTKSEEPETPEPKKEVKEELSTPNSERKKRNTPFRRVISEDIKVDERLADNSYLGKKGARSEEYGHQAARDLIKVRGKDFTREKNKRKRGSYAGGKIDQNAVHSIKFDNWSDSE